jgi:hypothetical protein
MDKDNIYTYIYHGELAAEGFNEIFVVLYGHLKEEMNSMEQSPSSVL